MKIGIVVTTHHSNKLRPNGEELINNFGSLLLLFPRRK